MSVNSIANSISNNRLKVPSKNLTVPVINKVKKSNKEDINIIDEQVSSRDKVSKEELIKAIESANKEFIIYDRRFEFSIHEKTNQIMVKVIDVNSDEIIREIPPEKILDMVACMWEIAGIIIDEKV